MLSRLRSLWRNLTHRDEVERELDAELRATLEILVDEKVATGLTASQAKRAASIELGGIEPIKDRVRDVRAGALMETLLQDARYALRHLRRAPGFAAAAILTLAFGIGANTAMFTMLDALVYKRLPIKDPDGLVSMSSFDERGRMRYIPFESVLELAKEGPFIDPCGHNGGAIIPIETPSGPTQGVATFISGRCFQVFGVTPMMGRAITDEDAPILTAGHRVVVISHRFWTRAYGADPAVIGKTLRTEGVDAIVIGVLPRGFGGLHVDTAVDIFAPPDTLIPARGDRRPVTQEVLGRLRPGVTLEQAQAEMSARWPALLKASLPPTSKPNEGADIWGEQLRLQSMGTGISAYRTRYAPALMLILGLTGLLLLLACINLGGLMLARLSARGTELAVRLALGGSQCRIAQQMLVESLLLSLTGAVLALPVAFGFIALLASFIPAGLVPATVSFTPDVTVLAMTGLLGVAVGLVMAALPTWAAMRRQASVRFTWDRTIAGATWRWSRSLLVAQVALSVAMVIGAGLLVRSLYLLQNTNLGVRTSGMLFVKTLALPNGKRGGDNAAYLAALRDQLTALPGVESVGFAALFPRSLLAPSMVPSFVGEAPSNVLAASDGVSPEYFTTVGIPLVAGRFPSWADTMKSRRVAVVSESLARALAPDGNVIERHVNLGSGRDNQDVVIVGVVGNATLGNPREAAIPVMYFPVSQRILGSPNIIVAMNGDAAAVAAGVRQVLQQGGREYAHEISLLDEHFARQPSTERMSATLAGAVGVMAVLLALIGVYGTLAYSVSRRTREIGVRVAIGAAPRVVANSVLREAFLVTMTGVAIGLPLAFLAARLLRSLLFGVTESDPVTFVAATAFFVGLGLAAAIVPARRAARVDPMIALRAE